ncbi:MAG: DUF494 domain-containing protein [Firmicutes bacterium]|nr:DUF494 domain-containing protein [Bacillota bacterium]
MQRITEIIHRLVAEVLHAGKESVDGLDLIKMLIREGYDADEIEQALSLVFSLPDLIYGGIDEVSHPAWVHSMRVFSAMERFKLELDAQDYLLGLVTANLLDHAELEHVLDEAVALQVSQVGIREVQWIVGRVVEDEMRSYLLSTAPLASDKTGGRWN